MDIESMGFLPFYTVGSFPNARITMDRKEYKVAQDALFVGDGLFRLYLNLHKKDITVTFQWFTTDIAPAGNIKFHVDGGSKDIFSPNPVDGLDLARIATDQTYEYWQNYVWTITGNPAFIDVDLSDLPENGKFLLLFR